MKTFKAEIGDVFTSYNPDDSNFIAWCYRGDKSVDIRDYVDGREDFTKDKRDSTEKDMTPQQLERWGRENGICIEWPEKPLAERLADANIPPHLMARLKKWAYSLPDGEPATVKESLTVPLTFREQAAIAAMQAMISCCRVNNLGVQLKDDFDSSYFNRETGMDHDQTTGEYDGCKEIAADAWIFADHMDAERTRRNGANSPVQKPQI